MLRFLKDRAGTYTGTDATYLSGLYIMHNPCALRTLKLIKIIWPIF
jgi:hypothetical protein